MKKVMLSVAVVATLALASCGGPSICDCVKMGEEMMKEAEGADEAKMKEIEEKYKDKAEACKKMGEEAQKDEAKAKEMAEEAKNCK